MATGEIELLPQGVKPPTSNYPELRRHISSGTETPGGWVWAYDDGSSEYVEWQFAVPANYASGPVLKIYYTMASAVADEVRWNCNVTCATAGVDDLDVADAAADNAVDDTVPGTAGILKIATVTLTNADGMAADDLCILKVEREGGHANDDAAGDAELWCVKFQYTTT